MAEDTDFSNDNTSFLDYFYGGGNRKKRQIGIMLGAASLFTSFFSGITTETQVIRLSDQLDHVKKLILDNVNSVSQDFAEFREATEENNRRLSLALCKVGQLSLQSLINEQKEITLLNFYEDLNYFQATNKIPPKLLSSIRQYCPGCTLPLSSARVEDLGAIKFTDSRGPENNYLAIKVKLSLKDYNIYNNLSLLRFLNPGLVSLSTLNNNRRVKVDIPENIWVDTVTNVTYVGQDCELSMLSDNDLFCNSISTATGCISDIIKAKKTDNCKTVVDYVDNRCTKDLYDRIGVFCRDSEVNAAITQTYIDNRQDKTVNITKNCTIVDLSKSTSTFICDGKQIFSQNSLTTYYSLQNFNIDNLTSLNVSLVDFTKVSLQEVKRDFSASLKHLTFYELLTIYVVSASALVLSITLIVYCVRFKKCCKARRTQRVNLTRYSWIGRSNPSFQRKKMIKTLKRYLKDFTSLLDRCNNLSGATFRTTKVHNTEIVSKIITAIRDSIDLIQIHSTFSTPPQLAQGYLDYLADLNTYKLYTSSIAIDKTLLDRNIPVLSEAIISEMRRLL